MSGTIAYCTREDSSYPLFGAFLAALVSQHPDCKLLPIVGNDIAASRNKAVMQSEGDWLWFIDTDMAFAPTTLQRLLAHNVDCVQVLCLKRHPPHEPILYEHESEWIQKAPLGFPGLRRVRCLGAGGTLYRKTCFERVKGPWFEGPLGLEDTNFARKLVNAGVEIYCDLATPVGHTTVTIVWPEYNPNTHSWNVRYDFMNGRSVQVPFEKSLIAEPGLAMVQ